MLCRRTLFRPLLVLALISAVPAFAFPPDPSEETWPTTSWVRASADEAGLDPAALRRARDYALTGGGSGYITRGGRLVLSWGDVTKRYDLKSTTKSIGVTALALAIGDGKIALGDLAREHHPTLGTPPQENVSSGWLGQITILHLATQTAGFEKPGGFRCLLFEPGTRWLYSDGGPNWLAECVTLAYREDLEKLLFRRVFEPIGITPADLRWRKNAYRPHQIDGIERREFGSGVHANVDAMARIGYLYLRGGRWRDRQLIPKRFVDRARAPVESVVGLPEHDERHGNASDHYGLLWWNNADGTLDGVPRDAYWSWGLYDSLIVVIPGLDLVVSRAGKSWKRDGGGHYAVLKPFLEPIVASVRGDPSLAKAPGARPVAPYPASPLIRRITWAPPETIVRKAKGGDNWPLTWGADGHLYTAYGDGHGFEPRVERKLSMGFARVSGPPTDFRGVNIRSETGETVGDGARGEKASGLLMVDGVLYLLARNAGNSRLSWSGDRGETWTRAAWKFTKSFGHPSFINFGKDYAGARDRFVYVVSHDSDSAYEPADRMVLARVPRDELRRRDSWRFLEEIDGAGKPIWTADIDELGAIFRHPGRCYRSSVSYNAALKRYLWCQIVPGEDTRFRGGFGIYDAPEPWGPWTTVYFTERWDVGPGENAHLPTKWMSDDGKTLHLVFSGDDSFSVRRAVLEVASP